jgi:hypothetical protein
VATAPATTREPKEIPELPRIISLGWLQILVTEVVNLAKPLTALSEEPLRSRVRTRMRRLDADGRRTTQQ